VVDEKQAREGADTVPVEKKEASVGSKTGSDYRYHIRF